MSYSAEQKLAALRRELKYRMRVFARRVVEGSMTQQTADYEMDIIHAMIADYEALAAEERLL